jgi:sulfoxide reductase heme-binding subunit YedZ
MTLGAESLTWITARAGGTVALALLTVSVLLGLALSSGARSQAWPRFALVEVHRFASLLAGLFVLLHGGALLLDRYVSFGLADIAVPGASSYEPLWTGLGVVGAELMLAIAITNVLRTRIGHRLWRRVHYLTLAVWALALAHGIGAGSDTGSAWATALYGLCGASVAAAFTWRVLGTVARRPARMGRAAPRAGSGRDLALRGPIST